MVVCTVHGGPVIDCVSHLTPNKSWDWLQHSTLYSGSNLYSRFYLCAIATEIDSFVECAVKLYTADIYLQYNTN